MASMTSQVVHNLFYIHLSQSHSGDIDAAINLLSCSITQKHINLAFIMKYSHNTVRWQLPFCKETHHRQVVFLSTN